MLVEAPTRSTHRALPDPLFIIRGKYSVRGECPFLLLFRVLSALSSPKCSMDLVPVKSGVCAAVVFRWMKVSTKKRRCLFNVTPNPERSLTYLRVHYDKISARPCGRTNCLQGERERAGENSVCSASGSIFGYASAPVCANAMLGGGVSAGFFAGHPEILMD